MNKDSETHERIIKAAFNEFKEKSFLNASLRNISKNAGITTGGLYRYYDSKEDLFEAIVGVHANYVIKLFDCSIERFEQQDVSEQTKNMTGYTRNVLNDIIDYIYDNHEAFKILLCHSAGTKYADFIHYLVEKEEQSTLDYIAIMKLEGHDMPDIDQRFVHMIASGMFNGLFEVIIHDMDREKANIFVEELFTFHVAGWSRIMNTDFKY